MDLEKHMQWRVGGLRSSVPWCLGLILFVMVSVFPPPAAGGESSPIRADIMPIAIRPRSNAPAYIDVKLQSRQQTILEGILELRVEAEGRPQFRQQTRELAIGPAGTTQRLLLPPGNGSQIAQLRFLTKKGEFDLGQFPLDGGRTSGRQYLIAICGSASVSDGHLRLWQALRPEWILSASLNQEQVVRSAPVFLAPEDLPPAIGLCAFDLLVLEGRSFAALEERQLTQIGAWVQAGGNLCVAPSEPLDAAHLSFLNQLAENENGPSAVTPEADGKLSFRGSTNILGRPGLGRIVIIANSPSTEGEVSAAKWKEVVSFLVRARSVRPDEKESPPRGYVAGPAYLTQSLLFDLLPKTTRMVPASFIVTLLGVFVLLVGPGEWMILGRLRKRRWTWITFPFFSIAFAAIAVRAAEHYMGNTDRRSEAIITDIGAHGRVLRQNHLVSRFAGRNSTAVMEIRQGLSVPCQVASDGIRSDTFTPLYQGSLTGQYTVKQALKQWRPQLQRTLSFGGDAEVPKVDWEQVDAQSLSSSGLEPLRTWIGLLQAQGWTVRFINGTQTRMLDQDPSQRMANRDLINALSEIRVTHRASWAATLSPTGQADLEDLALLDPSNPKEWLVVATKTTQQAFHIVRRLYIHE